MITRKLLHRLLAVSIFVVCSAESLSSTPQQTATDCDKEKPAHAQAANGVECHSI